jgi:hypothetical protein
MWVAFMKDGKVIPQYEGEKDNTLELGNYIIPNMKDLKQFIITGEKGRIGIDLEDKMFIIGDSALPFWSGDEEVKLCYFITRRVISGINDISTGQEQPKVFTIGYEDSKGKTFINLNEDDGGWFFSNAGVLEY